jgi:hypothetical protein
MVAYGGISGRPITPTPIRANEASMAGLRPSRSPRRPNTNAPSGRVRNPAPKVASDASKLAPGVSDGKKARPIWAAKNAYVTKS